MRPRSHRNQEHARRCGNCIHAKLIEYKDDLLCFHGDECPEDVGLMEGEEYLDVWAGRIVNDDDVCDEWAARLYMSDREQRAFEALIVAALRGITPEQIEVAMKQHDHDVTEACDGSVVHSNRWCPDCDCERQHLHISVHCYECCECGKIHED